MNALIKLLNNLEAIGEAYPELYDTDVKEQTGDALIEILFRRNSSYSIPSTFGMFSEEANRRIQFAFQEFASDCRDWPGDFNKDLELLGPRGAVSQKGQIAECFFGEITEDVIYPKPKKARHHDWLDTPFVFVIFLSVPGILILVLAYLVVPAYMSNGLIFLIAFTIASFISLVLGDYLWHRCANRTFRRTTSKQKT